MSTKIHDTNDDRDLAHSLRNGAMGYLPKTTPPKVLVAAIRGVSAGSLQFGSGILQQRLSSMTHGNQASTDKQTLTPEQINSKK